MKISLKHTIISVMAAMAMFISSFAVFAAISPTTVQAASGVSFTLSSSASSVSQGQSFNVSVGYNPGSTGAAAVTLVLHYDSNKLSASIASTGTQFMIESNINESSGTITFACMKASNVTSSDTIGKVSFTPKSGASGNASFSLSVSDIYDASYNPLSASAPSAISVSIAAATTTTTTTTTTKTTTTTPKETDTPKTTTTTPKTTKTPDTSVTTTPKAGETTSNKSETSADGSETTPADGEIPPEVTDDISVTEPIDVSNGSAPSFLYRMQFLAVRSTHSLQFSNACMQLAHCLNGSGGAVTAD